MTAAGKVNPKLKFYQGNDKNHSFSLGTYSLTDNRYNFIIIYRVMPAMDNFNQSLFPTPMSSELIPELEQKTFQNDLSEIPEDKTIKITSHSEEETDRNFPDRYIG